MKSSVDSESLADRMLGRFIRLAVTGLSRSGKTVFITSLIHQLLDGKRVGWVERPHNDADDWLGCRLAVKPIDHRSNA